MESVPIYTHFKEFITDLDQIETKLHPLYKEIREKFVSDFGKEPSLFVRVPYVYTVAGDNVTNSFSEKILFGTEDCLVAAFGKVSEPTLKVNSFDCYMETHTTHGDELSAPEEVSLWLKCLISGYLVLC